MRFTATMATAAAIILAPTLAPAALRAQDTTPATSRHGEVTREVIAVVTHLFDAMRTGDSAGMRPLFHPSARLTSITARGDTVRVATDSLEAFLRAAGRPHDRVYDERISNPVVHVDGPLAIVWTDYAFYLGGTFSHCGVDMFQLVRDTSGWRILAVTDTRRRDGCPQGPPMP
jgi:hypothetical protein